MEIEGKVVKLMKLVTGNGKNGEWKKQEFILETQGDYPKQVCISIWGDKIEKANVQEGEMIKASIEIASREYNERWYTDVRAWKVEREMQSGVDQAPPPEYIDAPATEDDDLPF